MKFSKEKKNDMKMKKEKKKEFKIKENEKKGLKIKGIVIWKEEGVESNYDIIKYN